MLYDHTIYILFCGIITYCAYSLYEEHDKYKSKSRTQILLKYTNNIGWAEYGSILFIRYYSVLMCGYIHQENITQCTYTT